MTASELINPATEELLRTVEQTDEAGVDDLGGDVDEFGVRVLGEPREEAERLVGAESVPFHQHALGLADQVA